MENVTCDLCGADNYTILNDKQAKEIAGQLGKCVSIRDEDGSIINGRYVICNNCGLAYINPRMTEGALAKFYAEDYRKLYSNKTADISEEIHAANAFEVLEQSGLHDKKLLDVGCNTGKLLKTLKMEHNKGLEPNVANCEIAQKKGLRVENTMLENYEPGESFEVVTLLNVLEHLFSPKRALAKVNRLLDDGGHILVSVPDLYNQYINLPADVYLSCAHLYTFSVHTLNAYFSQSGFTSKAVYAIAENMGDKIYMLGQKDGSVIPKIPKFNKDKAQNVRMFLRVVDSVYSMKKTIAQMGFK